MSTTHLNRPASQLSSRTVTDLTQTPEEGSSPVQSDGTNTNSTNASPQINGNQRPTAIHPKALEAGIVDNEHDPSSSDGDGELEPEMVDWTGPDDPENPKNWSLGKKWAATAIVSAFTFISPVSSSMVAPATDQIAQEFGISNDVLLAMITSIFVLAYAVGPLFLAPLSEIYGRSKVIQFANIMYLVWNLVCGFAQNTTQLIVFRFLAGLGGSAPLAIGGGVLGDCWRAEERGQAIAAYSLAPLLGPVIGPVAGAWIAERSTWRWVFWSTTIADGMVQILGVLFLTETFAPVLLERKVASIMKERGIPKEETWRFTTPYQGEDRHWKQIFKKSMIRPFALFIREPIIQLLGLYMAFIYGIYYLTLTTIPMIFSAIYHESVGIAGLNYIALGVGLTGASQLNARIIDWIYVWFKRRNGGVGKPEFRLPPMALGSVFFPIGLFLKGWGAQGHLPWIVTDIGIAFTGAGLILSFQTIQTYVIDAFTLHAASAIASVSFLRSLAGFGFPLFAPAMYNALGYGKGDTILAVLSIALGCPAPFLFWFFGERIRHKSRYADKSFVKAKLAGADPEMGSVDGDKEKKEKENRSEKGDKSEALEKTRTNDAKS